jgi:hypothetical protein
VRQVLLPPAALKELSPRDDLLVIPVTLNYQSQLKFQEQSSEAAIDHAVALRMACAVLAAHGSSSAWSDAFCQMVAKLYSPSHEHLSANMPTSAQLLRALHSITGKQIVILFDETAMGDKINWTFALIKQLADCLHTRGQRVTIVATGLGVVQWEQAGIRNWSGTHAGRGIYWLALPGPRSCEEEVVQHLLQRLPPESLWRHVGWTEHVLRVFVQGIVRGHWRSTEDLSQSWDKVRSLLVPVAQSLLDAVVPGDAESRPLQPLLAMRAQPLQPLFAMRVHPSTVSALPAEDGHARVVDGGAALGNGGIGASYGGSGGVGAAAALVAAQPAATTVPTATGPAAEPAGGGCADDAGAGSAGGSSAGGSSSWGGSGGVHMRASDMERTAALNKEVVESLSSSCKKRWQLVYALMRTEGREHTVAFFLAVSVLGYELSPAAIVWHPLTGALRPCTPSNSVAGWRQGMRELTPQPSPEKQGSHSCPSSLPTSCPRGQLRQQGCRGTAWTGSSPPSLFARWLCLRWRCSSERRARIRSRSRRWLRCASSSTRLLFSSTRPCRREAPHTARHFSRLRRCSSAARAQHASAQRLELRRAWKQSWRSRARCQHASTPRLALRSSCEPHSTASCLCGGSGRG